MLTITSYFGFLLVASSITLALFIGLSKIQCRCSNKLDI